MVLASATVEVNFCKRTSADAGVYIVCSFNPYIKNSCVHARLSIFG